MPSIVTDEEVFVAKLLGIALVGTVSELFQISITHSNYKCGDLSREGGVVLGAREDLLFSDANLMVLKGELYIIKRVTMNNHYLLTAEKFTR